MSVPELFVADRRDRGRLRLTGRDRQSFLQGMVTNEVASLEPGQGCYAFQLDATGHILADLRILCGDAYLLLDVEPGQAEAVAERLERHLIMERCRITDVTAEVAQRLLGGVGAPDALAALGMPGAASWTEGQCAPILLGGVVGLAARSAWAPVPTYDLYVPVEGAAAAEHTLAALRPAPIDAGTLEGLRIAAGVPRFGADLDSRSLAPESGQRERAIHYRKGCYIGQEIVARIDARGHTNRGLVGFTLDRLVEPETPVTAADGKVQGRITSCALSPFTGAPIALGFLRHELATPGTALRAGDAAATVEALP